MQKKAQLIPIKFEIFQRNGIFPGTWVKVGLGPGKEESARN